MEKQYEIIERLYPVNPNKDSVFSSLDLWIEVFAEKRLCAYQPQNGEVMLIRKEQRKFDQQVKQLLETLATQELNATLTMKLMELLTQTLTQLEQVLIKHYPENSSIEFGNFGLEGLIQVAEVNSVQQKHEELIIKNAVDKFMEDFEEILEEELFDWRE
ncbi:hypothetical protein [Enterococcus faecalis]|uniref:hypothetical protein n=1 Tax=Enterococcus faecalis TaxID=1351 RepID=UPI003D13D19A